mmetsp:Transcript_32316/g.102760  ORF Transcript_32316/g.102760 Transcript_32316/m.102760 type:complete len:84 (+) Transcript_32316:119-370(+)|eukprot:CAMPEP_0182913124 /NCGR_PEP_ID=MMETSP0034_2-20130328/37874_1 /TAXON_ID=156128 /ORGANISM="Nephroselmis pyriformis, Strain CCMP717" /LENGTH=83 /DNA_ID=CAMNT_0025049827 /DNA_START=43 /DNA_END=294 /DNA_ORIENTATION=+
MAGPKDGLDRSPAAQAEMQEFLEMEQKKRQFNQIVANITDVCWDTCMGTPGSKLSSSETSCLTYCAQRWFDATQVIIHRATGK